MRFLHSGRVVTSVSLSTLSLNPIAATICQALGGLFLHMYSLAISHRFTRDLYIDLLGSLPAHLAFFQWPTSQIIAALAALNSDLCLFSSVGSTVMLYLDSSSLKHDWEINERTKNKQINIPVLLLFMMEGLDCTSYSIIVRGSSFPFSGWNGLCIGKDVRQN